MNDDVKTGAKPMTGVKPLMRRIDYIRATQSIHDHGPPKGNNPYAERWGILPIDEIRRLVAKLRSVKSNRDTVGITDMVNETNLKRFAKLDIMLDPTVADEPLGEGGMMTGAINPQYKGYTRTGPVVLRRVSRWLAAWDNGMVVKKNYKITYLAEPPKNPDGTLVKKPDHVMRLYFDTDGRPRMGFASQIQAPKTMPKLFQKLETLGRK